MPYQNKFIPSLDIGTFVSRLKLIETEEESKKKTKQFHICKLSNVECAKSLEAPYIYDFFNVYFITDGSIDKINQIEKMNLSKNNLFFSLPGEIRKWERLRGLKGYLISFSKDFLMMLIRNQNLMSTFDYMLADSQRKFELDEATARGFQKLFVELEREYKNPSKHSSELIRFKIFELMIKSNRLFIENNIECQTTTPHKSCDFIYTRFMECIEDTYHKLATGAIVRPLMVKEYADIMNINPTYLGECVRKASGKSAKAIINKRTLLLAKCQLLHTSDNISEIAYKMGFESSGYFIRFFKKFETSTPLEFRNLNSVFA